MSPTDLAAALQYAKESVLSTGERNPNRVHKAVRLYAREHLGPRVARQAADETVSQLRRQGYL